MPTNAITFWLGELTQTDGTVERFTSLDQDITFEGQTWMGAGKIVELSALDKTTTSATNIRLQISLRATNPTTRKMLADNSDPVPIKIRWGYTEIGSSDIMVLGSSFLGRVSNPRFEGNFWVADLETYSGDVDYGVQRFWSDETQQTKYPGDKGFEYLRSLANGVEIAWPP